MGEAMPSIMIRGGIPLTALFGIGYLMYSFQQRKGIEPESDSNEGGFCDEQGVDSKQSR
jgi:hypothetical protein